MDTKLRRSPTFAGRVLGGFREVQGDGGLLGEADIMFAVYDVPDTASAVGNEERQVIDEGAFRTFMEGAGQTNPVQFYRDHGEAHITGYVNSSLLLGVCDNFRDAEVETPDGVLRGPAATMHYNLDTIEGSEAFKRLRFAPSSTQFSFRWPPGETVVRGDDGYEHVTHFDAVEEVSQVGFGAQALAQAMALRTEGDGGDSLPTMEQLGEWLELADFRKLLISAIRAGGDDEDVEDEPPPPVEVPAEEEEEEHVEELDKELVGAGRNSELADLYAAIYRR